MSGDTEGTIADALARLAAAGPVWMTRDGSVVSRSATVAVTSDVLGVGWSIDLTDLWDRATNPDKYPPLVTVEPIYDATGSGVTPDVWIVWDDYTDDTPTMVSVHATRDDAVAAMGTRRNLFIEGVAFGDA